MAEIPEYLTSESWLNLDEIRMPEPMLQIPEPMLQIPKSMLQYSSLSPFIIGVVVCCCCALILFLACIGGIVYFFLKKKPHMEIRKRSQIYMSM
jgi:hypothetical protein